MGQLKPHPLSNVVYLGRGKRLVVFLRMRVGIALDCRHVLPHRHLADVLRRVANDGAGAVERGEADLAVGQWV